MIKRIATYDEWDNYVRCNNKQEAMLRNVIKGECVPSEIDALYNDLYKDNEYKEVHCGKRFDLDVVKKMIGDFDNEKIDKKHLLLWGELYFWTINSKRHASEDLVYNTRRKAYRSISVGGRIYTELVWKLKELFKTIEKGEFDNGKDVNWYFNALEELNKMSFEPYMYMQVLYVEKTCSYKYYNFLIVDKKKKAYIKFDVMVKSEVKSKLMYKSTIYGRVKKARKKKFEKIEAKLLQDGYEKI